VIRTAPYSEIVDPHLNSINFITIHTKAQFSTQILIPVNPISS
jgi:hypothetical protein